MSETGLYVPGKDGRFEFRGVKEDETRQILTYEHDSGRVLLNFNAIFQQYGRKVQDIITITEGGVVMGLILTSVAMGPQEKANAESAKGG